jgi:putative methionine-R-sulfoxide reductase with GAF domain/two-component sensor histidine kinase
MQITVLTLIGGAVHTLVRLMRMNEAFLAVGRQMTGHLASQSSFHAAYQEAAGTIQNLLSPHAPYVFILLWDECTQRLKLVGAAGKPEEVWHNIALERDQGISGRVLATGKLINARDVRNPEYSHWYYLAKGFEDVRSEIAVPVIYQGKVIGVLDVESPRMGEFDERDQFALEGFAESLAVSFGHFLSLDKRIADAHGLVVQTIGAGSEHTRLGSWFAQVAESACSCLGASGLALVRLAPGTGYPLLPPAVWPKELGKLARHHDLPKRIPMDSLLWRLLEDWEIKQWNHEGWKEWDTEADGWLLAILRSMSVETLVFVPVGDIENPLATLFVMYPHSEVIGDVQILALSSFAAALEKSYQTVAPPRVEPRRMGSAVHQLLVPYTQKLLATTSSARAALTNPDAVRLCLNEIEQQYRMLRERIKRVTVNDLYDLSTWELGDALERTADQFQELRGRALKIMFSDMSCAEDEPLYIRQVLYRVIVEAIANAVEHGQADVVEVTVRRDPCAIHVQVVDDGSGIPADVKSISPYGIYYLRRILRRELGAQLDLHRVEPHGTRVVLRIPTRPGRG